MTTATIAPRVYKQIAETASKTWPFPTLCDQQVRCVIEAALEHAGDTLKIRRTTGLNLTTIEAVLAEAHCRGIEVGA